MRWRLLAVLLFIASFALVACGDRPPAIPDTGLDSGDPNVGGGVGEDTGPQTPISTPTPTNESSPRLDGTAAALATFPPASPTLAPTLGAPETAIQPPPTVEATLAPEATPVPAESTAEPAATSTAVSETNEAGEIIHVVQAGETLYRIGLQYGLSWVVIAEYNGLTNADAIAVGQELRIPPVTPEPTATAAPTTESFLPQNDPVTAASQAGEEANAGLVGGNNLSPAANVAPDQPAAGPPLSPVVEETYTVSLGDTIYDIARRYGTTWDQVAEANGLAAPNQIYAGQILKIPADLPGPTPTFTHQVHRGETVTSIALQYGLTLGELAEANGLVAPYVIYPGQVLTIPGK